MKRLIYAHRGLFDNERGVPENSLAAFSLAVEAGYAIELDVRLSKDGVPVVFHDKTLKRMCGDKRKVSSLSFDELKKLKLLDTDEKIPSLAEVLSLVSGRTVILIETKLPKKGLHSHRLERQLVPVLSAYKGEYLLQSFNRYSMTYIKRRLPSVRCGILSGEFYSEPAGFDFVNYRLTGLTPAKIAVLKQKYSSVFSWSAGTVSFDGADEVLRSLDIDGLVV